MPITRRQFLSTSALAALALRTAPLRAFAAPSPITLATPSGPLLGEQSGGVHIFRGVPFAEPPVGPLRFRPPVPLKPWTETRDTTNFRASAMQPGEPGIPHSEDCLYLNIWAPAVPLTSHDPLPVYVWIHGGGFTGGHAFEPMYDGTALARKASSASPSPTAWASSDSSMSNRCWVRNSPAPPTTLSAT